jgi:hypothetical protein
MSSVKPATKTGRPTNTDRRTPVAPLPYRPQPLPKVLQTKTVNHSISKTKVTPVAPPVYRPQPVPKVLQSRKPVKAPPVNGPLSTPVVAQKKINSHRTGPHVDRSVALATMRGIQSRGTVQRAVAKEVKEVKEAKEAKLVSGFFEDFNIIDVREDVVDILRQMRIRIPLFNTICETVKTVFGSVNVVATDLDPREAYYQNHKVYVNIKLNKNTDQMVNAIVMEITNAFHDASVRQWEEARERSKPKSAEAKSKPKPAQVKSKSAREIEYTEYHGVMIQDAIMKDAVEELKLVKTRRYAGKLGEGEPWRNFEGYLKDQVASGHTALYEK